MRKRLSSRLLAVILTIAICATTVLGCLITASAADSCYAFSTAVFAEDDLTQATMDVTFTKNDTLPDGFTAGAFTLTEVDADSEDCLTFKSVVAKTDGVNLVNEGNYYIFDGEGFDSVTFTLTFGFSAGEANTSGKVYKVKLTDVELAYSDGAYYIQDDANGAIGEISAGCAHSVAPVGTPIATGEGGDYGYAVYEQSVCVLCGEQFGYQLVPTAESLNDSDVVLPTEEDKFEGRTELVVKYDQAGDASKDPADSSNWVLKVDGDGAAHRTWGYIDADIKLLDETKENSEENPYIIENAEQLFYIVKIAGNVTAGKYYKVKDGIRAFHLNPNVTDETSFEDMMANINNSGPNWDTTASFQGHFDGNGVIITGIKTTTNHAYAGLFPQIKGNVTIKNVTVMNSYLVGKTAVGGFFGTHNYNSSEGVVYDIVVENCAIYQCYMQSTHASTGVGAIGGYVANSCNPGTGWINGNTVVNNCYVNLDEDYFISTTETSGTGSHGGAIGYQGSSVMNVTNSIFIGIRPYTARNLTGDKISGNYGWQGAKSSCYNNVYTTHPCDDAYNNAPTLQDFTGRVFTLSDSQFKGKDADLNMLTLDWDTVWATTTGYPTLYMPYNRPEVPTNIIYWDGTVATGITEGSGEKGDPYIINTAAELAWLVQQKADVTDGKYYKVADGIDTIVLQSKEKARPIMALDSASAVKSYFESGSFTAWKTMGWEQSCFAGYFDGNGATIYGMYAPSTNNAALFCTVDGGAAIVNIGIRNSYLTSSGGNYQVGALIGTTSNATYGAVRQDIVWVSDVVIANNYMYNNAVHPTTAAIEHTRSGIVAGAVNEAIQIENVLAYGNDATYNDGFKMPFVGVCQNNISAPVDAVYYDGFEPKIQINEEKGERLYYNMVKNSVVLGADIMNTKDGIGWRKNDPACYENCYTDGASGTVTLSNGEWTYTDEQIKAITAADAQGAAAQTAMPGLTWNTDWYVGDEGEYPAQAPYVTVGVANSSNSDFTIAGTNIVYEDDGSFSLNIHYIPAYTGFTPTMYVGDTNCTKLYILDTPVESSKRAEIGDNTAMMFTLKGISAKNIDKLWHPTLVAQQGASLDWSKSAQISVADTARATLEGNYDTADKNVAAAVLQYGDASQAALAIGSSDYTAGTIDLLEFGTGGQNLPGSSSPWYDTNVADNGETGSSWDDPIIIDSAEEFVYIAKTATNDTDGKYYKVADGIAGFDLSRGNLDFDGTLAENLAAIQGSGKNHSGGTPGFQGNFDGNGITVYGAWTNHESVSPYAGLFSCAQGDVTIKNVNVKFASFTATTAAGGIVGYYKGEGTYSNNTTLTIENCSVTESHLEITGAGNNTAIGAIVGRVDVPSGYTDANDEDKDGSTTDTVYVNNKINVTNCYVNLDETYFISASEDNDSTADKTHHGGAIAFAGTNAVMVSNCIVIGVTPYPTTEDTTGNQIQHTAHDNNFSNVYTDQAVSNKVYVGGTTNSGYQDLTKVMTQLTTEQLTGHTAKDNMPALDWNNVWTTTDSYPTFINANYEAPTSGLTISWDGSVAAGIATGSGTKADPYIIKTAAELAWLVQQKGDVTIDKYYKIADGISTIVLQSADKVADIVSLSSAATVKSYFESGSFTAWKTKGWEESCFAGYFDGNGATIYGMYATSTNNAALFCTVDAGATIKNIGIKNAYLTSSASNYQVAAIAAVASSASYGAKNKGVLAITGCTVANCYMRNKATGHERSGVIYGAATEDAVYMENCLVYGNDAYYGANYENKMALIGAVTNNISATTGKLPEGIAPKTSADPYYYNEIRNSIILGCDVMNVNLGRGWRKNDASCYTNVYSDMSSLVDGVITYPDSTTFTYAETNIKKITAADVLDNAADIVDTFNTSNGSTVWYVGAAGDYPGFKEAGALNSALQAIYDGITLTPDTYNDTGIKNFSLYATSLNLNSNPYMSFAFEFGGELKEKRDQITVTFTYTVNGTEYTYTTTPPAFEGDGTINGTDNWYNKPSAGRFHTYRFKDVPVEALANPIKVSASYGGTNYELATVSVGGLAYEFECQNKLTPSDYYATRIEAVKALLFYTQMIHARYGA